jgi:hypothetical protein
MALRPVCLYALGFATGLGIIGTGYNLHFFVTRWRNPKLNSLTIFTPYGPPSGTTYTYGHQAAFLLFVFWLRTFGRVLN